MGLFGQLHLGLSSLRAHQFGLEVTGDNIANVSTPGFSRRQINFSHARSRTLVPVGQLGGGVEAGPVTAVRSKFLEARHLLEKGLASSDESRYELLSGIEAIFAEESGFGFQEEMAALFTAFADLASQPESMGYREQVLSRAGALKDLMQTSYSRIDALARGADEDITRSIQRVNDLLPQIAELNRLVTTAEGRVPANAERDERAQRLVELSELIEISTYENADGAVNVTLRDGKSLVVGNTFNTIQTSPTGPLGTVSLVLDSTDVTALMGRGQVGGLLEVRDQNIPAYRRDIDTLALELMQEVNTLHQAGFALDGATTGNNFFVPFTPPGPGDPTGATQAMAIDPAVAADPSLIAAASAALSPGDGTQARAIADLSRALVLSGSTATFSDFYASFVFDLGTDVLSAQGAAEASAAVVTQVENQKLSVSAVSLDEEAVALIQFQRGYEASARFIRVIDELTELVMTIGA